jgi:hypothetical protein
VGRTFDFARSKYVVTNYHTDELLQIIIALEQQANFMILDYSRTFDDSNGLLKLDVSYEFTVYLCYFGSL